MRIPHYLRRTPSGRWQFVQRVPSDLVAVLGKKWLIQTLGTHDRATAQRRALEAAARYADAFAQARGRLMAGDDEKALQAALAALYSNGKAKAKRLEIEGTTPSGHPFRIKTDGSAAENAAAKDMVATLFESEAYRRAVNTINTPAPAAVTPPLEDQLTLFFATETEGKQARTMAARRRVADAFADFKDVGRRRPVGEISKAHAVAWLDDLATTEDLSKPSRANYASHMRVIFSWMVDRGVIEKNPFSRVGGLKPREKKQRRGEGYGWEPFSVTTLRRIFDPSHLAQASMDHVRWGAILGLYTGARVGEIAQLLLRDFEKRDGVPCLIIRAEGYGQRLKTEQSARVVPLHPDLIRLGLWYEVARRRHAARAAAKALAMENGVDEKAAALSADEAADSVQFFRIRTDRNNGKGDTISKGFSNLLDALGVKPKHTNGTMGFHSFRKTIAQALQSSKVPEERRRAYLGHEPGESDSHATAYMRPWTATEMSLVWEGISWGQWIDFDGLRPVLASGKAGQRRAIAKAKRVGGKKKKP